MRGGDAVVREVSQIRSWSRILKMKRERELEREEVTERRMVDRTLGRKGRKDGKSSVTGHITGKSEKE